MVFPHNINTPVIGLSPMDGVTDAPYRYITQQVGKADLIITEFVHVMGLCRGGEVLYRDLIYDETERPIIAQIYGAQPEYFYHAAKICCYLGFDGIDINMGCPAKSVVHSGGGAALIRTPDLAVEIIRATRRGIEDFWQDGELTGIEKHIKNQVYAQRFATIPLSEQIASERKQEIAAQIARQQPKFTLSVKTRIGYDQEVGEDWAKRLSEESLDWLGMHGRTLKQMYLGQADWDALARARAATRLPFLANGDIKDGNSALAALQQINADGVLIGRASFGNPWIFRSRDQIATALHNAKEQPGIEIAQIIDYKPTAGEVWDTMEEHARLHVQIKGEPAFTQMRKHFAWYAMHLANARDLRPHLVRLNNVEELKQLRLSMSQPS
jgi:tRNA-dihydrouridine synthase B